MSLFSDTIQFRVRYGETDQMGVVYHANYIIYFELGRTEWLRKLGVSYKWMEENNVILPIIDIAIQYKSPAYYDDILTLKTTLQKLPSVKVYFKFELYNEKGNLLALGATTLAFMKKDTNKPMRAPDFILNKLQD